MCRCWWMSAWATIGATRNSAASSFRNFCPVPSQLLVDTNRENRLDTRRIHPWNFSRSLRPARPRPRSATIPAPVSIAAAGSGTGESSLLYV